MGVLQCSEQHKAPTSTGDREGNWMQSLFQDCCCRAASSVTQEEFHVKQHTTMALTVLPPSRSEDTLSIGALEAVAVALRTACTAPA